MTAEILNQLHAGPQSDFLLRDILPGAGWAPYIGRDAAEDSQEPFEAEGDDGTSRNGLQLGFQFEV
jgi:hypothetical protein